MPEIIGDPHPIGCHVFGREGHIYETAVDSAATFMGKVNLLSIPGLHREPSIQTAHVAL